MVSETAKYHSEFRFLFTYSISLVNQNACVFASLFHKRQSRLFLTLELIYTILECVIQLELILSFSCMK